MKGDGVKTRGGGMCIRERNRQIIDAFLRLFCSTWTSPHRGNGSIGLSPRSDGAPNTALRSPLARPCQQPPSPSVRARRCCVEGRCTPGHSAPVPLCSLRPSSPFLVTIMTSSSALHGVCLSVSLSLPSSPGLFVSSLSCVEYTIPVSPVLRARPRRISPFSAMGSALYGSDASIRERGYN